MNKYNELTIIPCHSNQNIVDTKFIYKIKNPKSPIPPKNFNLVCKGFTQVLSKDYIDTLTPIPKPTTIRFLFTFAVGNYLHIHTFDLKTTFVFQISINLSILNDYPRYDYPKYPHERYILLLNKSLYGLKQSAWLWSYNVKNKLSKLGFQ